MATDAALGALLGAAVGDAAGAPLEFIGRISPEQADEALMMPGGGVLGVGPGQVCVSHQPICNATRLRIIVAPGGCEQARMPSTATPSKCVCCPLAVH